MSEFYYSILIFDFPSAVHCLVRAGAAEYTYSAILLFNFAPAFFHTKFAKILLNYMNRSHKLNYNHNFGNCTLYVVAYHR